MALILPAGRPTCDNKRLSKKISLLAVCLLGALVQLPTGQTSSLVTRQAQHRPGALLNFEVAAPPDVPKGGKACEVVLLQHTFANSYGHPAKVAYHPPTDCGPLGGWASVAFNLTATSQGTQYDRLGLLYLDGVEVWRTSTAEPTRKGIIWTVLRDMTRYMPLLRKPHAELSFTLNNLLDLKGNLTGEFEVTLSAKFYEPTNDFPAAAQLDEIVSIGNVTGQRFEGHLEFPQNTATAFVEIFASGNAQEEFWYTNVPDEYVSQLDPNKTAGILGRGAFREVQLWIDGILSGVIYPFPVIYTGGILLSWWRPIAAIGAFDAPSFTLDVTPFAFLLAKPGPHNLTITIQGDGSGDGSTNPDWIISGSVGITLGPSGHRTTGELLIYDSRSSVHVMPLPHDQKGRILFTTEASRELFISAKIRSGSSASRIVQVSQQLSHVNMQTWGSDGNFQEVRQLLKGFTLSSHNETPVLSDYFDFPLNLTTMTLPTQDDGTLIKGQLSHSYAREESRHFPGAWETKVLTAQDSDGTLRLNKAGRAESGVGRTSQRYDYVNGRGGTYKRDVEIFNVTRVVRDEISGTLAAPGPANMFFQTSSPEWWDGCELEGAPCRTINGARSLSGLLLEESRLIIQLP